MDWLMRHSGGNPATAGGLLQGLVDSGADVGAPDLQSLSGDAADWIGPRIEILQEKALRTLQVLALLDRPIELGELMVLADCPSKLLLAILIELVRARLVEKGRQGDTYAVGDSLVRDLIAERMGDTDRRKLHRELGRALLASGRVGEGASHLLQAADVGDTDAIDALWASLQQAEAREAYGDGAAILRSIVDLLPPGHDGWAPLLSAQTFRRLADCRPGAHQTVGMDVLQAAAARLNSSEDPASTAALKLRMTRLRAWSSGELEEAESDAKEALSLFEQVTDRPGALLAAHELTWIRGLMGDLAGSQAEARRVLDEAEATGNRRVTTLSLHAIGLTAAMRGRFQEAEAAVRGSIGVSRGEVDRRLLTSSLAALAVTLGLQGRLAEAFVALEEARSTPVPVRERPFPVEWEILLHWLAGDASSALASSREANAWAPERLSRRRALGMVLAALSALDGGQPDEADHLLTEAAGALGERDWLFARQYLAYGRAQLGIWQGRMADSIRTLQSVASDLLALDARPFAAFVLVDLAEACGATGAADVCREAAASLEDVAQRLQRPLFRGFATLAGSWSALTAGHLEQARTRARTASTLLAATGCRAHLGRAQQLNAQLLSSSDPVEAASLLEAALTTFETCGALGRRDRARLVRETLTPPESASDRLNGTPLTSREREVARLAAEGHSLPEIARRLFLDQGAVDAHLRRACTKLGLSSPLDLVLRATEFGLR
ncbi:MAG TPA: LuxR C-terminal-related transcriptional regulator [Actinomycetota bacterium]|nr:LuxR C-terminal-related transcriptional regulator [Actinomycetota bacterium]